MSKTNLEKHNDRLEGLLAVAENKRNHILDRIDAYLELAQFHEKDNYKRAICVRSARDLIAKDL